MNNVNFIKPKLLSKR